jgi:hypothetical protein
MQCEKLPTCPFYNEKMPIDKGLGAVYRQKYCVSDNSKCARYMVVVAAGPQAVPLDLYPNMTSRAEQIIANQGAKK